MHSSRHDISLYNRTRTRRLAAHRSNFRLTTMFCLMGLVGFIVWFMG